MGRSRFRPRSCRTFSQFRQSKTKAAEKTAALHDAGARSGHPLKWADQDSVRARVVHLVNFGNRSKKRQKRQPHYTTLARGPDNPLKWADQDSVRGRVVHLVNFGNRSKKRQKRQAHSKLRLVTTLQCPLQNPKRQKRQ